MNSVPQRLQASTISVCPEAAIAADIGGRQNSCWADCASSAMDSPVPLFANEAPKEDVVNKLLREAGRGNIQGFLARITRSAPKFPALARGRETARQVMKRLSGSAESSACRCRDEHCP